MNGSMAVAPATHAIAKSRAGTRQRARSGLGGTARTSRRCTRASMLISPRTATWTARGLASVLADVDGDRPLKHGGIRAVLEGPPIPLLIEAVALLGHGTIIAGMMTNELSPGSTSTHRSCWNWCSPAPWAG
jgi:hypothetical protein